MTNKEIVNLLYAMLSDYSTDATTHNEEIKKGNPYSQEYRESINKYNTAINKKCCVEEILGYIEGSEET